MELNVTPSAVSHKIRLLEGLLGVHLFDRSGRSIEPTADGGRLLPKLGAGFALINEAMADHHVRTAAGPLRLSVVEIFALYWLLPRLSRYPLAKRGFELEISASPRLVSFETENVDVAIRSGNGCWPGVEVERLLTERLGIYRAPGKAVASVLFVSVHRAAEWTAWQQYAGRPIVSAQTIRVDSTSLAIKAAVDGAGWCLAGDVIAQSEVEAGRLELVERNAAPDVASGYWLVQPKGKRRDPRFRNFRQWLLQEIANEQGVAA